MNTHAVRNRSLSSQVFHHIVLIQAVIVSVDSYIFLMKTDLLIETDSLKFIGHEVDVVKILFPELFLYELHESSAYPSSPVFFEYDELIHIYLLIDPEAGHCSYLLTFMTGDDIERKEIILDAVLFELLGELFLYPLPEAFGKRIRLVVDDLSVHTAPLFNV